MLQGFTESALHWTFNTPRLETPGLHDHIMHSSTTQRLAHTVDRSETVEQTNVYLDAQCAEKL
jgi:hypothetical protein